MKQLRNQMVAVIKERFNRVESMKETEIDTMVAVEIMLNGCILIDSSMKMYDAWSILAGHDEVVLPPKADLSIVRRLRVLVPEFRYENYWIEELESYFRIEGTYRLFEKSEEGKIKKIKPVIFPERDSHYHALLTKPLEKVANSQSFLGDEPFRYVRMEEGVRKEFRGNIPPSILNGTHRNLPLYKKKVRFEMDPSKWKNIGFEMDQKTNGQKNYQKRAGALKLKSTAPNKQAFKL